jgi:hypothetical protein
MQFFTLVSRQCLKPAKAIKDKNQNSKENK